MSKPTKANGNGGRKRKAAREYVAADIWGGMTDLEREKSIPFVSVAKWDGATAEEREAPAKDPLRATTPCACLPFGSEPGIAVWDGFNWVMLPRPEGVGKWRLIWDSAIGWTWEAVN